MKTLIRILIIISLCIGACYLQSCVDPLSYEQKCSNTVTETRNISVGDLSKVPYTGFDTLYFLNKQGDTCIVRGTGKQTSYEVSYETGNPACPPPRKFLDQVNTIEFVPIRGSLEFILKQKCTPQRIYIDRLPYSVIFNNRSLEIDYRDLTDPYYIDNIILNNKQYSKISVFLTEVRGEEGNRDTTYKLLYNKPYGILYMKSTKQNEEFSIIPKP